MKHTIAFLTATLTLIGLLAPTAHAAPGPEEQLPTPPPPPASVPNFGTTVHPDGTPLAVVVTSGTGGMLNVIDLNTGKHRVESTPLTEATIDVQAWGFARLPDNSVLIGSAHHLFRYDPAGNENEVEHLTDGDDAGWNEVATKFESIWDIAVDDSGTAYLATNAKQGGAHILTWRADKGWGLLPGGDPVSSAQYAQSIDHADGHVYVGTGTTNPQVIRINVATGARTVLPMAEGEPASGTYEHLEVHGGWLYVNKTQGYGATALNLATGEHRDLKAFAKQVVPRPDDPGKVYLVHQSRSTGYWLYSYDPATDSRTAVLHDEALRGRLSPLSFATADLFVSNEKDTGELSVANLATGKVTLDKDLIDFGPRAIQSMTAAGNGKLYASWYMTAPTLLEITPAATVEATGYRLPEAPNGQAESMAADGDWLATGLYPGGLVHIQSLSDPDKATTQEIGHGQDRPYAAIPLGDGDFAFGSVPGYGQLGGALSIHDAATGTLTTYPFNEPGIYAPGVDGSLLRDLAPISLARRGDKIFLGTTNRGGHQMFANTRQAYVVEFDLTARKVTAITRVLDQQVAVTGLTVGADGVLYGITGQHVFRMAGGRIEAQKLTGQAGEYNRSWLLEHAGTLYAVVGGQLWSIPTGRFAEARVIANSGAGDAWITGLTLGPDQHLHYAKGAELFRKPV